jgi:hypothetical protein
MTTIKANVTAMFAEIEPCYVSGSASELGDTAGGITWANATTIAFRASEWLLSSEADAVEGMRDWARESGGWGREEIELWSTEYCLGLFVQNVASELRMLGSDDDFESCASVYAATNWDGESEFPTGSYYVEGHAQHVDYYTGL